MSDLLPPVHLALACLWLGCIVTEALVERTLFAADPSVQPRIAEFHWRAAAFVEMPALLGVLFTGASALAGPHAVGTGFRAMVTAGMLTIFVGVFKAWLARKRVLAARAGRQATLDKLRRLQQPLAVLVLVGVLVAVVAGIVGRGGG